MALLYHPDKNPSKDTTELFRKILDAYKTLVDE
jgi:DnaJ-class molecular chaperone